MFHWFFCLSLLFNLSFAQDDLYTDILVVGGGASGTAAGIQAARMGASVILVEETTWLGGMLTSAGVSAVDGNYHLPAGLWGEFKDGLVKYYGSDTVLQSGWVSNVLFEPSAGDKVLKAIAGKEKNLSIFYESVLKDIHREKDLWQASVKTKEGLRTIHAKLVIDATELGDVARSCGVKYDVGMDSRFVTGETIAPAKANHIIQDLTYVAILKDYGRDMTMPRPAGYDSS
ncbi:MAG TPA: FAD-dependent oxidoreductase, partial [Bacteroidales bacterium]|nr:FAD-dependent oxidoreductase [Bacteroidales bacterium]